MSHKDLGHTWLERGRPDLAEKELRRALADDPNDSEVMVWLSHALHGLDRREEALEIAENAVGIDPEWPEAHLSLSRALSALGNPKRGAEVAREAIELDPDHAGAWFYLGVALGSDRRWEGALEATEKALAIDPEFDAAANLRAQALIQLGRAGEADLALGASLRHNPDDPDVHEGLGWKALHEGDHKAAIEHYREALRLDPESDTARAGMVEALNARNIVYRTFLRFSLWLTRLPGHIVFMVMIGLVIGRGVILGIADSNPGLGPILMPVYYLTIAVCLFTWVAAPLFNTLLRFDKDGKYALDNVQIRQANWFAGWLLVLVATIVAWAVLGSIYGVMAMIAGFLMIPIVSAAGAEGKSAKLMVGAAAVLFLLGAASAVEILRSESMRLEAVGMYEELGLDPENPDVDKLEADMAAATEEEAQKYLALAAHMEEFHGVEGRAKKVFDAFLIGFVAYTWLAGGTFSTGVR